MEYKIRRVARLENLRNVKRENERVSPRRFAAQREKEKGDGRERERASEKGI